jgi:hypothetical protein
MWRHYTASTFDHCMTLYKTRNYNCIFRKRGKALVSCADASPKPERPKPPVSRWADAGYRGHDRISFVLTEGLAIKRIAPLDVIKEEVALPAAMMTSALTGESALTAPAQAFETMASCLAIWYRQVWYSTADTGTHRTSRLQWQYMPRKHPHRQLRRIRKSCHRPELRPEKFE